MHVSPKRSIRITVLSIHALFLLFLWFGPLSTPQRKAHKPLIVKMITPKSPAISQRATAVAATPRPQASAAAAVPKVETQTKPPAPSQAAAIPPKPQKPPTETKTVKKEAAVADKRIAKKAAPKPAEQRSKISDALLKELEESIAKIEDKSDKGRVKKSTASKARVPLSISLQIDRLDLDSSSSGDSGERDYADFLIGHLRESLHLPDYGEVKMELTLRQDGSVASLRVLHTESDKNKRYLESNLPLLRFPRFTGAGTKKREQTYILTFCNE